MERWSIPCVAWLLVAVAACSDGGEGTVRGRVFDAVQAMPSAGAVVKASADGRTVETTTDAMGKFELAGVPAGKPVVLSVERPAHAKGVEVTSVPKGEASYLETFLAPVGASGQVSAEMGGELAGPSGATMKVPPASLTEASGMVDVEVTPIGPARLGSVGAVPGEPVAVGLDGARTNVEVASVLTVSMRKGGQPVDLAEGKSAEITLPAFDPYGPSQMKLYALDETTGRWREEGTATKTQSRSGVVYKARVDHFSSWAVGRPLVSTCLRGCVVGADGEAAVGARITAVGLDFDHNTSVTAGRDGCFAMDTKAGGQVRIRAVTEQGSTEPIVRVAPEALASVEEDPGACADLGTLSIMATGTAPECPHGFVSCGGTCVDLQADSRHCGQCGRDCSTASPFGARCIGGQCGCATSERICFDSCTDVTSDPFACGSCNNTCGTGEECLDGTCQPITCEGGTTLCMGDFATCADLDTDPLNCGRCGNVCSLGVDCVGGGCAGSDGGTTPLDGGVFLDAGGSDGGVFFDAGGFDGGTGIDGGSSFDSGSGSFDAGPFDGGISTFDSGSSPDGG